MEKEIPNIQSSDWREELVMKRYTSIALRDPRDSNLQGLQLEVAVLRGSSVVYMASQLDLFGGGDDEQVDEGGTMEGGDRSNN